MIDEYHGTMDWRMIKRIPNHRGVPGGRKWAKLVALTLRVLLIVSPLWGKTRLGLRGPLRGQWPDSISDFLLPLSPWDQSKQ